MKIKITKVTVVVAGDKLTRLAASSIDICDISVAPHVFVFISSLSLTDMSLSSPTYVTISGYEFYNDS